MSTLNVIGTAESGPSYGDFTLSRLDAIFVAEGFRRVSIAELAKRLRCSRRKIYEYADSKEKLFLLVLQKNLDQIYQIGLEVERETENIVERIEAYVESAIIPVRRWSNAFLADIQSVPEASMMLEEHLKQRMERLKFMVESGIESGDFRPCNPTLVAEMIQVTGNHICHPDFLERADTTLDQAVKSMCDIVWNGLETNPKEAKAILADRSSVNR